MCSSTMRLSSWNGLPRDTEQCITTAKSEESKTTWTHPGITSEKRRKENKKLLFFILSTNVPAYSISQMDVPLKCKQFLVRSFIGMTNENHSVQVSTANYNAK